MSTRLLMVMIPGLLALLGIIFQLFSTRMPKLAAATGIVAGVSIELLQAIRVELAETNVELAATKKELEKADGMIVSLQKKAVEDTTRINELECSVSAIKKSRSEEHLASIKREQKLVQKVDQLIQVVRRLAKQLKDETGIDPNIDSDLFRI